MTRAAALFVDAAGVYAGRPDVDLWPVERDARRYPGPWPVVAHPPCPMWGWHARQFRRDRLGQDGGCFEAALRFVHTWGGVIEHPAASSAWAWFGLQRPGGWGWTRGPVTAAGDVWVCAVDQGHYGHVAPKRTWLYLVTSTTPPPLRWEPSSATGRVLDIPAKRDREATPAAFAAVLLALATGDPLELGTGDEDLGQPRCAICGAPVTRARFGPPRDLCSPRCRQRASRQARVVSRARNLADAVSGACEPNRGAPDPGVGDPPTDLAVFDRCGGRS